MTWRNLRNLLRLIAEDGERVHIVGHLFTHVEQCAEFLGGVKLYQTLMTIIYKMTLFKIIF